MGDQVLHGANKKGKVYRSFVFLVEVVGFGGAWGWEERKVEVMSSVDRSVRHCAFEVFMRCSGGDVQLPVISK